MSSFKTLRVQQILLEEISSLIVMRVIKDPRIDIRTAVMNVKVSRDTTNATVFISGYLSDEKLQQSVDALNHAKGFIQRRIAEKYALRNTPKLAFKKTQTLKEAEKVIGVIEAMDLPRAENISESTSGNISETIAEKNPEKNLTNNPKKNPDR